MKPKIGFAGWHTKNHVDDVSPVCHMMCGHDGMMAHGHLAVWLCYRVATCMRRRMCMWYAAGGWWAGGPMGPCATCGAKHSREIAVYDYTRVHQLATQRAMRAHNGPAYDPHTTRVCRGFLLRTNFRLADLASASAGARPRLSVEGRCQGRPTEWRPEKPPGGRTMHCELSATPRARKYRGVSVRIDGPDRGSRRASIFPSSSGDAAPK
jgi:hypothetical protein